MGRQAKYEVDDLLDVAVELFAEGGVEAVTVAGVARRAGASSGSMYHRFDGRAALLAELWLRTVEGFQAGYLEALGRPGDPRVAARGAVSFAFVWVREHEAEARILIVHRLEDFLRSGADPILRERAERLRKALRDGLEAFRERLEPKVSSRRVRFALLDLPYAAVRNDLSSGSAPDDEVVDLVTEAIDRLL